MALITVTRTINGTDWNFYQTEDDGGTLYGINQDAITSVDVTALQDVDTNGTGANLKEKLDGYRLITNGQDGLETYQPTIVNIDRFVETVRTNRINKNDVVENDDSIADLSANKQEKQGGTTANRPSNPTLYEYYFDTTVAKPIWYNGTNWVDATGTTV